MDRTTGLIFSFMVALYVTGVVSFLVWAAFRTHRRVEQIAAHLGLVAKPQGSEEKAPQRVAETRSESR